MGFINTIISPIAVVFGYLISWLFDILTAIGIGNVGLAIILLTVIVKIAMFPLLKAQLKQSKISRYMAPEMRAIRAKYRGRRDEVSLTKQNMEIKALYEKYGISQTGGCLQLVIQMPILFALYNVIRNIPKYIGSINILLKGVLTGGAVAGGIMADPNYVDIMNGINNTIDWSNVDTAVNGLNAFSSDQWSQLAASFPAHSDLITSSADTLLGMNNFLGLNISLNPNQMLGWYILVPICSAAASLLSAWLARPASTGDSTTDKSQMIMMFIAPAMSGFIAFTVPAGLGIYWISTSLIQAAMSVLINRHYDKIGAEEIIRRAAEKREKKLGKKKSVSAETVMKSATINTKRIKKPVYDFKNTPPQNNKADDVKNQTDVDTSTKPKKKVKGDNSFADKIALVNEYKDKNIKNNKKK